MTARPGGHPAADGGELEALRKVSQCQPVRSQGVVDRRAIGTGRKPGCAVGHLQVDQARQRLHVERDHAPAGSTDVWFHAAAHRRPTPIGDHGDIDLRGPVQHVGHLRLRGWAHHRIRGVVEASGMSAGHVPIRPAVGVLCPVTNVDRCQGRQGGGKGNLRLGQRQVLHGDRLGGQEGVPSQLFLQGPCQLPLRGGVRRIRLHSPSPV